jgi:hypothetical protein
MIHEQSTSATSLWAVPRTSPLTGFVMAMAISRQEGAQSPEHRAPQVPALLRAPQQTVGYSPNGK